MPSMKEIKRRLISVKNTQQIMKAMNLVAASKLQKYKNRLEKARPLINGARQFLEETPIFDGSEECAFFEERPIKKSAFVIITAERGLCGGYNTNILKKANEVMADKNESVFAIGSKCRDYLVRRNKNIVKEHVGVLEIIDYRFAQQVAKDLCRRFISDDPEERFDELYIAYTKFETMLTQVPTVTKVLPLVSGQGGKKREEIIFEPDVVTYLMKSAPVYLTMFLYGAMLEAGVCEQASRMTSMDSADRNAGEIIDDLTLQYNRQRQSAITQEISEIVGGANAV